MANGHGGARPGSGPKTGADGKAVKPYTRREPKKTRDRSPESVASVLQTHPEARRRPLMSDHAIMAIVEAFREQQTRARNRPRTPDWNPYIIRPDRFGPGRKALKKAKLAMDDNTQLMQQNQFAVQAWQAGGMMPNAASEGLLFLGYPYLSELAQRPEFRLFGEIRSEEMTRKWVEIRGTEDESTKRTEKRSDELATERNRNDDDRTRAKERKASGEKPRSDQRNKEIERKILELKDLTEEMKVRACFKNLAAQDDYFGISHLHIDLHGTDLENPRDKENASSIGNGRDAISKEKLKRGCLRGLRVIEPIWCYPTNYNAFNPLAPDWYDPAVWYVMGAEIHKTRLLPFIGRPVPDILKPAYAFGGLSMTQMAQPYVDIWLRTRESVGEIIHAFSVMILATELGTTTMPGGSGGGNGDVVARMMLMNMLRDNQGTVVIDKNTEDFKNVSAPLGGLDDLQAQAQEHLFSVGRIPAVKFAGIQPKGLNATSEGEMRAFNDTVHGQQEHLFRPGLTTVFDVMQYHLWGERDPDITYDFLELHELTPKEKAEVTKLEAETDQIRIDSGVVSQEEVRAKLVADPDSGFHGLDPDDVPDLLGEEQAGLIPPGAGRGLEAEIGQPGAAGAGGGAKPRPKPQKKSQPAGEDSAGDPSTVFKADLAQAKEVDRLGYLSGLRNIRIVRDRDQWNAGFDPDEDRAVFQRKFLDLPDEERLRVILHEGAHRGQFISDVDTFGRFVRLGLGTEESFLAMANEVHLKDFEETGEVDDLDGEVFAESYARFCLGMEMPQDLLDFWTDRAGDGMAHDEWRESLHPRRPDGKFGTGGGGGASTEQRERQQEQKGGQRERQMGERGQERERQMGERERGRGEGRQAGGGGTKGSGQMSQASRLYTAPQRTPSQVVEAFPGGAEAIQQTRKKLAELVPTNAPVEDGGHKNPDGTYTAEREALHRKIVDKFFPVEKVAAALPPPGERPVLTMLGGRGGSGKSWLTREGVGPVDERTAILLDSDAIKGELPGYEGWNAAAFHEESSHILDMVEQRAVSLGVNTIVDATMKSEGAVMQRLELYEAAGYEFEGYYMYASPETAATRAMSRYSKKGTFTGRFVPPEVIYANKDNEKNFDKVSPKFRKWAVYDNNTSEGPKLVGKSWKD